MAPKTPFTPSDLSANGEINPQPDSGVQNVAGSPPGDPAPAPNPPREDAERSVPGEEPRELKRAVEPEPEDREQESVESPEQIDDGRPKGVIAGYPVGLTAPGQMGDDGVRSEDVNENTEDEHVPLSAGTGGTYKMVEGKRVRVFE